MMMLILAPKPTEGINEKLYSNHEIKNRAKNTSENHENEKPCSTR
jgi:hypothetical protein